MFICMYVCIHVCMYIGRHDSMHIWGCIYVCMYICRYMCIYVLHTHITYVYMYVYACIVIVIGNLVKHFMECWALWKVLYIGHWLLVLANLLCLSVFWWGATSSHLNSLRSTQWCCLTWHTQLVKPFAIMTSLSLILEELEALWLGANLTVHWWSLMCANHTDMTAHTPAFLLSCVPLVYMWSAVQLGPVMYHTMEQCQQDGHPPMY